MVDHRRHLYQKYLQNIRECVQVNDCRLDFVRTLVFEWLHNIFPFVQQLSTVSICSRLMHVDDEKIHLTL